MLSVVAAVLETLSKLAYWLGVVVLFVLGVAIAVVLNVGVFTRYVLNDPVIWSEELARFLLIWITFVGASVAVCKNEMLAFQFSTTFVPQRYARVMQLTVSLLTIAFLVIFLWFGLSSLAIYKLITSSATSISLIWPASGMVVGAAFMIVHILAQIFNGPPAAASDESTHVM